VNKGKVEIIDNVQMRNFSCLAKQLCNTEKTEVRGQERFILGKIVKQYRPPKSGIMKLSQLISY
jgi:Trm5-related predicted tRNA methylase